MGILERENAVYGESFQVRFMREQRRHYPRYPLRVPVAFVVEGAPPPAGGRAEGLDISLGGLGLSAPPDGVPPVGAHVRLRLMLEDFDEPVVLEGEVTHADPRRGFGVRFPPLASEPRKHVKRILKRAMRN